MRSKQNCWEFMKCGRELGGVNASSLGVCPAASATEADGFAGGKNGGRACAYITGTFCGGMIQGGYKDKQKHCDECEFYKMLKKEHSSDMSVLSFGDFLRHNKP